jgi:hypothetical protein
MYAIIFAYIVQWAMEPVLNNIIFLNNGVLKAI